MKTNLFIHPATKPQIFYFMIGLDIAMTPNKFDVLQKRFSWTKLSETYLDNESKSLEGKSADNDFPLLGV